jgi:hypothetical protein
LIQQPQYTQTTTKYNFPHLTLENNILPQRFMELSLRTIKNIGTRAATFQTNPAIMTQENNELQEEFTQLLQHGQTTLQLKTIPLQPKPDQTPIIAVDVSSIRLGETDTGILLALRAATAWKQKGAAYRYLRFGPFPIHITDQNQHDILSLFHEQSPIQHANNILHQLTSTPDLNQTQTRITALLEKWLQTQIATQAQHSIILLDGNLTTGTNDPPNALSRLLETARNNHNTTLAMTKITRLRLNGHNITELMQGKPKPCLLQLDGYQTASAYNMRQMGALYVAKLNHSPYTFRLDIDANIQSSQAVEAVEHLIGNDLITDGYPETLRLAHIYSTFTANEVIGIQRFLAQVYGIKIVQRPNIRRLLFGPYGTKHES